MAFLILLAAIVLFAGIKTEIDERKEGSSKKKGSFRWANIFLILSIISFFISGSLGYKGWDMDGFLFFVFVSFPVIIITIILYIIGIIRYFSKKSDNNNR